jgi:hypothetical protein
VVSTAILATQLTNHGPHAFGLYLDGLDVIKEPASPSRFAVPIDSITITEAAPGGVSSMDFEIDDPGLVVPIYQGATVLYMDLVNNWPLFLGFIQNYAFVPDFGGQGRHIEVTCYGIEALLDSIIIPSLVVRDTDVRADGTAIRDSDFLQQIASYGPLRQFGQSGTFSSQAMPIMSAGGGTPPNETVVLAPGTTLDVSGMTIRQAFEAFRAAGVHDLTDPGFSFTPSVVTVDFYGGVRYFFGNHNVLDYAGFIVSDTPTGTLAAANMRMESDQSPGLTVSHVYVKGASAAATGWVVGDATLPRSERYVTTTGTTEAAKQAAAQAILSDRGAPAGRGSFDLLDFTPINAHPGSQVFITDFAVSTTSNLSRTVSEITKTFKSNGNQDWHVSWYDQTAGPAAGGPPSASRLIRSLTRGLS